VIRSMTQPTTLLKQFDQTDRRPFGVASGISLGLIVAAGAAAILAFHAISFVAQMIATPIILGIGVAVAVHIVLYGPKESLKCATDLLSKAPQTIQTIAIKTPATLEHIAHMAARILPKVFQSLKIGAAALPVTPYVLQALQKEEPPKKQRLPVRILQTIHSKLTPKLLWVAKKTVSLPFQAVRSVGGVIVTPVIYGVVALAVLHIALRPDPSKKMAKELLLAAPNALRSVAKAGWQQSQQAITKLVKRFATTILAQTKSKPTTASSGSTKEPLCLDL
jgi:hypothetical protein